MTKQTPRETGWKQAKNTGETLPKQGVVSRKQRGKHGFSGRKRRLMASFSVVWWPIVGARLQKDVALRLPEARSGCAMPCVRGIYGSGRMRGLVCIQDRKCVPEPILRFLQ